MAGKTVISVSDMQLISSSTSWLRPSWQASTNFRESETNFTC